MIPKKSG